MERREDVGGHDNMCNIIDEDERDDNIYDDVGGHDSSHYINNTF
jgi:hypothetical protein